MSTARDPGAGSPAGASDPLEEKILRRVPLEILILAALLAPAVGLLFDLRAALVFFAGGALAAVGFLWLKHALNRVLARDKTVALRSGILLYALRLVLICGAFFIIILLFPKKILAFGAGFSLVVPVFLAEGVRALRYTKTWKA